MLSVSALSLVINPIVISVRIIICSQPTCYKCLHYHWQLTHLLSVSALSLAVHLCVISLCSISVYFQSVSELSLRSSMHDKFCRLLKFTLLSFNHHSQIQLPKVGAVNKAKGFPHAKPFYPLDDTSSFYHTSLGNQLKSKQPNQLMACGPL